MRSRVLLGMSGGVDSSVAAMLLQDKGFEVIGVTFLFSGSEKASQQLSSEAKLLAHKLNIKHITVDLREVFGNTVVNYFKEEYLNGKTPFPCAFCNPNIKFYYLEKYAMIEKCDYISTGHYARIIEENGLKYIHQGVDPEKDQSFFLWGLKRNLINKLIFPLGVYSKKQIRKIAKERGHVSLAHKKDSLGICFIEGSDYRKFLEKEGIKSTPGNFVDKEGNILGQHCGITNYTIGQRRGLGLTLNFPVFVAEIRLDANEIVLAKYKDLYKTKLTIKDYYIIDNQPIKRHEELIVKVRYRLQETLCNLNILDETRIEVELLQPEAMIAPGQTAVFYKDEKLMGGGFIESAK